MAIQNINDYAGMWANGVNIGELWDKVKAKFVSGAHDQSDATAYPATWKQQARANIGLTIGLNQIWYGSAANTVGTITTTALGRALLGASIDKDKIWYGSAADTLGQLPVTTLGKWLLNSTIASGKMWYASANNTLSEVTTSAFGRGLLNANSNGTATMVANLFAEYAQKDEDGDIIKQTYANYLDISGTSLRLLDKQSTRVALATVALNAKNGLLKLDNTGSAGKIPLVHIPDSIMGQLTYGGTITAYTQGTDALTVSITTDAKAILEQKTGRTISGSTIYLVNSSTTSGANFNYADCKGMYFIWTDAALADHTGETARYRIWPSGGPRYQAGDWMISNDTKWDKVDNTDAVTGVKGSNESAFRLGNVTLDALDVRALATYGTNATQSVEDNVQFNNNLWALGGVAAHGISDLHASGSGGGGLSGSILRNWSNYNAQDETQILGSNLGIKGFRMSGSKFQFSDGANNWSDGFTLSASNIPNLELTQINGTTELRKIETLSATGTPSGYLTRAANGNWSFATIYAPTAVGSNGQVLKSAGSGNPSWVDQSTLSVGSAAQLTTARNLWGQSFDGTADVNGDMYLNPYTAIKWRYAATGEDIAAQIYREQNAYTDATKGDIVIKAGTWTSNNLTAIKCSVHNDDYALVIRNDGKVGIGTYQPDTKFHVNGNIKGTQLISTQAQGTAPLVVTSTTKVANLNADKLDGYEASGLFESLTNDSDQLKIQIGNTSKLLTLDYAKKTSRMRTEIKADQEFVYRQSPQTIDADSLVINKFKGRTVVWNQMISYTLSDWRNRKNLSITGTTFSASETAGSYVEAYLDKAKTIQGHKYYCYVNITALNNITQIRFSELDQSSWISVNVIGRYSAVMSATVKSLFRFVATTNTPNNWGYTFKDLIFVDLTLMYGSAIDGMTDAQILAKFERDFPDYPTAFNAGELRNNDAKQFESVGFNKWDEEWEVGSFVWTTGEPDSRTDRIRSKNFTPVFGGQTYYLKCPSSSEIVAVYYDANKNVINAPSLTKNSTFVVPNNAAYMKICDTTRTTYANDICINLSDSAKNGTYVPYRRIVTDLNLDAIQVKSHNIWDEEWELGVFDTVTGINSSSSTQIRSKHLIAIKPNTTYYCKLGASGAIWGMLLDKNGNAISASNWSSSSGTTSYNVRRLENQTFVTSADAAYVKFYLTNTYGTTYNNDICISESSSFNGQYEPHGILTINGLKQAGSVYDEIMGNKLVKRVGDVDLGDLNWTYYTQGSYNRLQSSVVGLKPSGGGNTKSNIICSSYESTTPNIAYVGNTNKVISGDGDNSSIYLVDSNISSSDVVSGKVAKLNGVGLNYELATPIEYELASPIPDTMPAGTTERIISDRLPVTPFACDMTYGANPKDILASAVPFSRLQGVRLERGAFTMSTQNDSNWYLVTLGDKKLYLRFTVNTGAFKLEMASDDTENPEYSKSFEFATLSTADINAICV